jgi:uncharacterized protein (DUF2141 family)
LKSILLSLFAATLLVAADARAQPGRPAPVASANMLQITVYGVKSADGHVRTDVCTKREFLKDCRYTGAAPAVPGATTVIIEGLTPGRYAVQAYHDKNDDHEVDRNIFGIPTEGVGFSNARIGLRAPRFGEAAFDYAGGMQAVTVRLQHFAD